MRKIVARRGWSYRNEDVEAVARRERALGRLGWRFAARCRRSRSGSRHGCARDRAAALLLLCRGYARRLRLRRRRRRLGCGLDLVLVQDAHRHAQRERAALAESGFHGQLAAHDGRKSAAD
jgi:hypothetical protein